MIPEKEHIKNIDTNNIEKCKTIDYDEPMPENITFTCLVCEHETTLKHSSSYEGHNLICNNCIQHLSEQKHLAINTGMFIIKIIHNNANIWDVLPLDCFAACKNRIS